MANVQQAPGAINLKPNKPDAFEGKRDFLAVSSWIFKMEQYLSLTQLSNPTTNISDENRITFASSFFTGNAASWWFTVVRSGQIPSSWNDFKALVVNEFIPNDHERRARDKLRRLKQTLSVSKYLSECRNCTLGINDISDGEKFDRFVQGLKKDIRVEVLKSQCSTFDEAANIALRIDSALWSTSVSQVNFSRRDTDTSGPVPMEIGNVQRSRLTEEQRRQRATDLKNNACTRCHTKKCRPWICSKAESSQKHRVNNFQVTNELENMSDDDDYASANDESEN